MQAVDGARDEIKLQLLAIPVASNWSPSNTTISLIPAGSLARTVIVDWLSHATSGGSIVIGQAWPGPVIRRQARPASPASGIASDVAGAAPRAPVASATGVPPSDGACVAV